MSNTAMQEQDYEKDVKVDFRYGNAFSPTFSAIRKRR